MPLLVFVIFYLFNPVFTEAAGSRTQSSPFTEQERAQLAQLLRTSAVLLDWLQASPHTPEAIQLRAHQYQAMEELFASTSKSPSCSPRGISTLAGKLPPLPRFALEAFCQRHQLLRLNPRWRDPETFMLQLTLPQN